MNSELFFEGKKYVSSKRASKISRYNQDYIGQLIRDSKLEARRVGRSWFVSLESLEKHIGKIKGVEIKPLEKTPKIEGLSTESKPLFLEGKKFISSKEASDLSGYSRDYIGQLVRDEKLEARMVGRLWYVSALSLQKHLEKQGQNNTENKKAEIHPYKKFEGSPVSQAISYQKEEVLSLPKLPQKEIILNAEIYKPALIYPAISPLPKKKILSPFSHFKKVAVVASVSIVLVFVANIAHYEINKSAITQKDNSVLASASVLSKTSFESLALDWYKYVNGKFIGVSRFFASMFGISQIAYQPSIQTPTNTTPQGIVVMPKNTENEETVERIKNSFSDQVGVSKNPDGVSGVITPVFKKVSGDEYLYVLVPVNEKKQ